MKKSLNYRIFVYSHPLDGNCQIEVKYALRNLHKLIGPVLHVVQNLVWLNLQPFGGGTYSEQNQSCRSNPCRHHIVELREQVIMTETQKTILIGKNEILLERSQRAKQLSVSVKPFVGTRVAVPKGVSLKQAEKYAFSKNSWIQKQLDRVQLIEKESVLFWGSGKIMKIKSAEDRIISRTKELSKKHGYLFESVTIRKQSPNLGYCRGKKIYFNIALADFTDSLLDYLILFELVHTVVKGSSIKIIKELGKYYTEEELSLSLDETIREYARIYSYLTGGLR